MRENQEDFMFSQSLLLKENALKIAKRIVEAGRINDLDDYEEMKIEFEFELNALGWDEKDHSEMLQTVKDQWYK